MAQEPLHADTVASLSRSEERQESQCEPAGTAPGPTLTQTLATICLNSGEEPQPPTDGLGLLDQAATHRGRDAKVDAKLGDELRVDRDGLAADLVEVLLAEHHLRSVCGSAESV